MKPDDSLSSALHGWRIALPPVPGFRAEVWQRIDNRRRVAHLPVFVRAHAASLALALVVTVGFSTLTGRTLARMHAEIDRETLATAYLADLDVRAHTELKE